MAATAALCLLALAGQAQAAADTDVRSVSWQAQLPPDKLTLLADATQSLVGHPMTRDGARTEAARLTEILRHQGLPVAIVLVTEDGWSRFVQSGELRFRVFEGQVGQVRIGRKGGVGTNTSRVNDDRLVATTESALCGGAGLPCPLTSAGLERAQLLVQEIPGVRVDSIALSPEGVGLGQTAVELTASPSTPPVSGAISTDNYGAASTGRQRVGANLVFTDLMHEGDVMQLGLQRSRHQTTGSLGLSVPLGTQGWRARLDAQRSTYGLNQVDASGVSNSLEASLTYPTERLLDGSGTLQLGAFASASHMDVAGQAAFSPRHIAGLRQTLYRDAGERAREMGLDNWNFTVSLTEGRVRQTLQGADTTDVVGGYAKLAGSVLMKHVLDPSGWYVLGTLRGQLASRNLDGSERMPLGGVDGVRAYRTDEGQVDEGLLASVELRRSIGLGDHGQIAPGVFVDALAGATLTHPYPGWQAAEGYMASNLRNSREIAGWGLGVDWAMQPGLTGGLTLAWRLPHSPDSINYPGSAKSRLLATLGWQL